MSLIRLLLTGSESAARQLVDAIESIDGVSRVETIADLMPQLDDPDSSSAGLRAEGNLKVHTIEVDVTDASTARRVQAAADQAAIASGAVLEVDNEELWDRTNPD